MEWGNAAGWTAAFVAFMAVNASTIQWLLKRRDEHRQRDSGRVDDLERQLTDLRCEPAARVRAPGRLDHVQRHARRQAGRDAPRSARANRRGKGKAVCPTQLISNKRIARKRAGGCCAWSTPDVR